MVDGGLMEALSLIYDKSRCQYGGFHVGASVQGTCSFANTKLGMQMLTLRKI